MLPLSLSRLPRPPAPTRLIRAIDPRVPLVLKRQLIEPLLNRTFAEPLAEGEFDVLEGRRISLHIEDLGVALTLTLEEERFLLSPELGEATTRGGWREFLCLATRREDPDALFFQRRLVIEGDTAVVGRDFENNRDGAAYIYGRNVGGPDNWGFVKRIADADGKQSCCDDFGGAVAISGDTIAVGERLADRVHIFERNLGGLDNWGRVKVFSASDGGLATSTIPNFFFQVSIEGDTLVVGAGNHTHAGGSDRAGAVYVFDRNTGGPDNWGQVKEIFASDAATFDRFGSTTALSGDTLIAGTSDINNNAA